VACFIEDPEEPGVGILEQYATIFSSVKHAGGSDEVILKHRSPLAGCKALQLS
jgi:hypothetical protein